MATDAPRENGDAALLRRTRLRLLAWSGGLTLVILVVLGSGALPGGLRAPSTRAGRISSRPAPTRSCGCSRCPGQIPGRFVLGPGLRERVVRDARRSSCAPTARCSARPSSRRSPGCRTRRASTRPAPDPRTCARWRCRRSRSGSTRWRSRGPTVRTSSRSWASGRRRCSSSRRSCRFLRSAGWRRSCWPSRPATSTRAGRSSRSGPRWTVATPRSGASASSPRTRATSCGRR